MLNIFRQALWDVAGVDVAEVDVEEVVVLAQVEEGVDVQLQEAQLRGDVGGVHVVGVPEVAVAEVVGVVTPSIPWKDRPKGKND